MWETCPLALSNKHKRCKQPPLVPSSGAKRPREARGCEAAITPTCAFVSSATGVNSVQPPAVLLMNVHMHDQRQLTSGCKRCVRFAPIAHKRELDTVTLGDS
jgi:hypothetical protein